MAEAPAGTRPPRSRGRKSRRWGDAARLALGLALVWALWSGHSEPLIVGFGVVSCGLVVWLSWRMDAIDPRTEPYRIGRRLPAYLLWLLWQIARANWRVARTILAPGLPIRPRLVRVPASQKTELGQAIHANSITLTPGTLALDVRDGTILAHALDDASAAGLETGEMDRRAAALERLPGGAE